MHVLAIEPYYGGSHRAFLDRLVRYSTHDWSIASLPPRHWKWRMRSAPIAMLNPVAHCVDRHRAPDVILCSDMLDLPTWLGLAIRQPDRFAWLSKTPVVTYFHENQWAYPVAPDARPDHHFGYTNLLTAIASDACWFNSNFNRDSFIDGCRTFLKRMPDGQTDHNLERVLKRSQVIAPGFDLAVQRTDRGSFNHRPVRIGWVGRFEHDKRPDRFRELLSRLSASNTPFELLLLGERGRRCESLSEIQRDFSSEIVHDGYAETRSEYERLLRQMDIVVSTADHEFFGIAVCEAIWSGAIPVTPNGLSYTEYVPEQLRYDTVEQAAAIISDLANGQDISTLLNTCQQKIEGYRAKTITATVDLEIQKLAFCNDAAGGLKP